MSVDSVTGNIYFKIFIGSLCAIIVLTILVGIIYLLAKDFMAQFIAQIKDAQGVKNNKKNQDIIDKVSQSSDSSCSSSDISALCESGDSDIFLQISNDGEVLDNNSKKDTGSAPQDYNNGSGIYESILSNPEGPLPQNPEGVVVKRKVLPNIDEEKNIDGKKNTDIPKDYSSHSHNLREGGGGIKFSSSSSASEEDINNKFVPPLPSIPKPNNQVDNKLGKPVRRKSYGDLMKKSRSDKDILWGSRGGLRTLHEAVEGGIEEVDKGNTRSC